jgi:putative ABC transport system substrate-binding protein
MKRRTFLLASSALLAPRVHAQGGQRVPRVGYLFSFVRSQGEHLWQACRQGLQELGYVEGRNIQLEPRWADGRHERLPGLVAELVRLQVDVIVAAATPANQAAKSGAGKIPVVMVAVADPVAAGLAASLARPGGNLSGLSLLTPELSGKRLELLAEIARPLGQVVVLGNPDNRSYDVFLEETRAAGKALNIAVQAVPARGAEDIGAAFEAASRNGAQGLIVFDDPVLWSNRKRIVELAARARLPAMYGYSEYVSEGGLISYGPHRPDLYRRTAAYVDRILKGAKPAELPIERPTRFELFANLRTARALGLSMPSSILLRADGVIE